MFLELRHLRTLVELRDSGSLAGAAVRLHLTQSALSHQLKSIENQYDTPLFVRKSKPLRFTPLGLKLLELANAVLPQVEATEQTLKQYSSQRQGQLHLAVECHSCFDWLLPAMNRYREKWPEMEMDVSGGFVFEALPALAKGQVDIVITSDPQKIKGLRYEALFNYEALLAIAPTHPLNKKKYIEPQDLADQTLITYPVELPRLDIYSLFLKPAGVEPTAIRKSELTLMILQLVASGRGVSGLPSWVLAKYLDQDFIAAKSLGKKGIWNTLYAAVREADFELTPVQAFIRNAREVAASTLDNIKPFTA